MFRHLAGPQPVQKQGSLRLTAEIADRHSPCSQHSAHLVVLSLLNFDLTSPRPERRQPRREALRAVSEGHSLCKGADILFSRLAGMLGVIALPDAGARADEPVGQYAIVCK